MCRVLPVRTSVNTLLYRSLETPDTSYWSCVTARCVRPPEVAWTQRCHGSGRAGSRDFIHQWPWVLHYPYLVRLCVCGRTCIPPTRRIPENKGTSCLSSFKLKENTWRETKRKRESKKASRHVGQLRFTVRGTGWLMLQGTDSAVLDHRQWVWLSSLKDKFTPKNKDPVIIYSSPGLGLTRLQRNIK